MAVSLSVRWTPAMGPRAEYLQMLSWGHAGEDAGRPWGMQ